jgi:uncharacterized protein (DUF1330 family)
MKRLKHLMMVMALTALVGVFSAGALLAAGKPKTVIHVVTVKWKEGTTPEQIRAALDGVEKMGQKFPGIKNVWLRTIKAQGAMTHAIVMEFESEQALKDYAGSAAQKEWYKVYIPIREQSITFDITN